MNKFILSVQQRLTIVETVLYIIIGLASYSMVKYLGDKFDKDIVYLFAGFLLGMVSSRYSNLKSTRSNVEVNVYDGFNILKCGLLKFQNDIMPRASTIVRTASDFKKDPKNSIIRDNLNLQISEINLSVLDVISAIATAGTAYYHNMPSKMQKTDWLKQNREEIMEAVQKEVTRFCTSQHTYNDYSILADELRKVIESQVNTKLDITINELINELDTKMNMKWWEYFV